MSPADRRFWLLAQRRVAGMQGDVAAALLRSLRIIRESISEAELARLIADGSIEQLIAEAFSEKALDRAFLPLRQRLRTTTERGFKFTTADLPRGGRVDGEIAVMFDHLNPKVLEALQALDTRVLSTLKDDVRETVREAVRVGLEAGRPPRLIAKEIRSVIGLGPSQVREVQNFRDALAGANGRSVTAYQLRNRTVDRLLAKGPLTPAQIDRYTELYRQARVAQNAATVAKTATLDAYKQGQALSWQAARDNGVIPPGFELMKTWVTVGDDRVRDEHVEMQGETVPFDSRYSNGEDVPGESTYNCRCVSRVFMARAA